MEEDEYGEMVQRHVGMKLLVEMFCIGRSFGGAGHNPNLLLTLAGHCGSQRCTTMGQPQSPVQTMGLAATQKPLAKRGTCQMK